MRTFTNLRFVAPPAIFLAALCWIRPASAVSIIGALSNFDCFNDTGQETHGFEIELDGLRSSDVLYTFGGTYNRYGSPAVVDFPGGVYVRYQSSYNNVTNTFNQATPIAVSPITPTMGHQCWTGGMAGYITSGCEHFGVSLARSPTNTVYRWLVADPTHPGQLTRFGTNVNLPAPVWSTPPPAVPNAPQPVRAQIQAPPPSPAFEFGDAYWVKVYVTEAPNPAELDHLVTDDPAVPQEPAEVEMEWHILQASARGPNGELASEGNPAHPDGSVTRRYEFYKYTGAYDPENHEAICADGSCDAPAPSELGDYLGAQMVAANLVPAVQVQGVTVTTTGFVYSRVSKTYAGVVTLKNGAQTVPGPLQLQFWGLPNGVSVVKPTGAFQGYPYLAVPNVTSVGDVLAPNQVVSIPVQFNAASPINFLSILYSGSIQ